MRRLVATYKRATDDVIEWITQNTDVALECPSAKPKITQNTDGDGEELSAEDEDVTISLHDFARAVQDIATRRLTMPTAIRFKFQLAIQCRYHAARRYDQEEREESGSITVETESHEHFNKVFQDAYARLNPSHPLPPSLPHHPPPSTITTNDPNAYGILADLPPDGLMGTSAGDFVHDTPKKHRTFLDDIMDEIDCEIRQLRLTMHMQDLIAGLMHLYKKVAAGECSWLHAAWVTTALIRDLMSWGRILAWVSRSNINEFEKKMSSATFQLGQDASSALGMEGYRGEVYTGLTKGPTVRNSIEAIHEIRTMLASNDPAVERFPTTLALADHFPPPESGPGGHASHKGALVTLLQGSLVHSKSFVGKDDIRANMISMCTIPDQIQAWLFATPRPFDIQTMLLSAAVYESTSAFLMSETARKASRRDKAADVTRDNNEAQNKSQPHTVIDKLVGEVMVGTSLLLRTGEIRDILQGFKIERSEEFFASFEKQNLMSQRLSRILSLDSLCTAAHKSSPQDLGHHVIHHTPMAACRFISSMFAVMIPIFIDLSNLGSYVGGAVYLYTTLRRFFPDTLARVDALETLAIAWDTSFFHGTYAHNANKSLLDSWLRYNHKPPIEPLNDVRQMIVPSTYNGGNRIDATHCRTWEFADPDMDKDMALRRHTIKLFQQEPDAPNVGGRTVYNFVNRVSHRITGGPFIDMVNGVAADAVGDPKAVARVNMLQVFRLCVNLMSSLGDVARKIHAMSPAELAQTPAHEAIRSIAPDHWQPNSPTATLAEDGVEFITIMLAFLQHSDNTARGRGFMRDQSVLQLMEEIMDDAWVLGLKMFGMPLRSLFWQNV